MNMPVIIIMSVLFSVISSLGVFESQVKGLNKAD